MNNRGKRDNKEEGGKEGLEGRLKEGEKGDEGRETGRVTLSDDREEWMHGRHD